MSYESSLAFFLAVVLFALTPGPGVFAIIARALALGWRPCLLMIVGIAVSDLVYLLFACYGLAYIASYFNEVFTVIRLVGALYLIYLGWRFWNSPVVVGQFDSQTAQSRIDGFLQGFLISSSNPKVMLFYLAFLPGFVDLSKLTLGDVGILSVLTGAGIVMGTLFIAFFAARLRVFFHDRRSAQLLNRTAGVTLMGVGGYIASQR